MEEIKAGDIMLNNWFHVNGYPMYVDSIFRDIVYLEFEGNDGDVWEENIKDLKPIPLTEDILLKAGFEINYKGFIHKYPIDGYKIGLRTGDDGFRYCLNINHSIKIKYLHQLQNLFKSLTGNDLKIEV